MELDDSFTEKLIQRTKARKEKIRKIKDTGFQSTGIKRPALIEESQISSLKENSCDDLIPEESPKRQCLDASSTDTNSDEDDKENSLCHEKEPDNFIPIHSNGPKRGLAALKKKADSQFETTTAVSQNETDSQETSLIAKPPAQYQPDIAENLNYIDEDDIDMEDEENLNEESKCTNEPCAKENVNPIVPSYEKTQDTFKFSHNEPAIKLSSPKLVKESTNNTRDPAELPLSARKALFERAFFGESSKSTDSVFEPKLSVAQRAAMFEKASRTSNQSPKKSQMATNRFSPVSSPVKFKPQNSGIINSPVKITSESPKKQFKNSSEDLKGSPAKRPSVECTLSPSKTVGSHTRLVQQRLIENANTNWQQNELVAKAADQRKTELSNLVNHWEKMSSSSSKSSESTNNSDIAHACFGERNSVDKYEPVFQNDENFEDEVDSEDEQDNENVKNESIREASEDEYSENLDNESESNLSDITDNTVNGVCGEMDELLDAALDTKELILQNEPEFKKPASMTSKTSSYNSYSSVESDVDSVSDYPAPPPAITSQNGANPDVPLLYTVSLYRKKKQEVRTPPVRTIVRREQVMSPPSPEVDRKALIQDRIERLTNEVLSQQTVISQTSQALNLCQATAEFSGSTEQVEGERLLLIATQKRQACLNEIQRLKTQGSQNEFINDGTGTLTISDIQLSLKREFMASELQGKSNDIVHNFLCLFRHGSQVIVSQMLSTNDTVTDGALCFTNHIKIQNLQADFSVVFEVYALQTKKDSIPHEKKYHIKREHSKLRLTPKVKRPENKILLPAISSPGGPNAVRSPSFGVVGYTRFTIQNFSRKVFSLDKVPFVSPLDGILKAKIRLHAEHRVVEKGFLTMFEDVSGFGAWHRRWCVLDGHYVSFWKYPDDEHRRDPMGVINLKQCVTGQVRLAPRDECARPHTFQIVTVRPQSKGDKNTLISRSADTITTTKHLLSADTKEERILWCNKLNEALTNARRWDPQAVRPIA